jgi:hypothetical protein
MCTAACGQTTSPGGGQSRGGVAGKSGTSGGSGGVAGKQGVSGVGGTGQVNDCGVKALSKPQGRPENNACPQSPLAKNYPDAGSMACSQAADCTLRQCLHGKCSADECVIDSDCSTGSACGCAADYYGGNGVHGNPCVMAQCRVDVDCGPVGSGFCSPSFGERCGGLTGYFCHSSADTCNTDADCCGSTPACRYQSTLGHWACQSIIACNG